MIEVNAAIGEIHLGALDAALRSALGDKIIGLSTYGSDRPISVWMTDAATSEDVAVAQSVVVAHDPVFLSVDKTSIVNDGVDEATIIVQAVRPDPAPVILIADGYEVPVSLENGVGSLSVSSIDAGIMVWAVKDAGNRTADKVQIEVRHG